METFVVLGLLMVLMIGIVVFILPHLFSGMAELKEHQAQKQFFVQTVKRWMERRRKIILAIDVSGGMMDSVLKELMDGFEIMAKDAHCTVECMTFDTDVQSRFLIEDWDGRWMGRGGSDLHDMLATAEDDCDGLIVFSDMYQPPVKRIYNVDILWLVYCNDGFSRENTPYKLGTFVKLTRDFHIADKWTNGVPT
jgi:predicted metal-dependent peptidase